MRMPWREFRALLAIVLAAALACPPAHALVALNDGRDRIYISGSVSMSQDSNIFANSDEKGDVVYSSTLTAEYTRRAGWIGVNGIVSVSSSYFGKFTEENFNNPRASLELTKQTGRTTGSITLSGARESRADPAVNVRSESWNYTTGVNVKYPIVGAYTLSGHFDYSSREYVNDAVFADLATYSASVDLLRILSSQRQVSLGYRYRFSETSFDSNSTDHAFSVGMDGKLIRGVMGGLSFGYQTRNADGRLAGDGDFNSWTASGRVSYAVSKRLNFGGQLTKDFSTSATNSSVDVLAASLSGEFVVNSKLSFLGGLNWTDSRYLGEAGRVLLELGPPPVLGANRHDENLSWDVGLTYSLREYLKITMGYAWSQNWSTLAYADFVRTSWNVNLSTRW